MRILGELIIRGADGVEVDVPRAVELMTRAAENEKDGFVMTRHANVVALNTFIKQSLFTKLLLKNVKTLLQCMNWLFCS